jgi:dCTP deaminase
MGYGAIARAVAEKEGRAILILNDNQIAELCLNGTPGMISPYVPSQVRQTWISPMEPMPRISYGQSSYGYDVMLAPERFKIFSPVGAREIDPKRFDANCLIDAPLHQAGAEGYFLLPPLSYGLGVTVETFALPRDVAGICMGKSTYARSGLIVNTTPLEPGWCGRLVVEFSNTAPLPIRLYVNEGIGQVLFFQGNACEVSYADRAGKYQGQDGLTTARV